MDEPEEGFGSQQPSFEPWNLHVFHPGAVRAPQMTDSAASLRLTLKKMISKNFCDLAKS